MKRKNKAALEFAQSKQHIEQKKAAKARKRATPLFDREMEPTKWIKKSFLIFCDGVNTEPSYFDQFQLPRATIEVIGEGYNTISLVKRAIQIRDMKIQKGEIYDFVWCVFDADPKPSNHKQAPNFTEAIRLAAKHNIEVAYSNQAFEYWLILHFEDHQGGSMLRTDYNDKLNRYLHPLGCHYDGKDSKKIEASFFEQMLVIVDTENQKTRQDLAIERAQRILQWHQQNGTPPVKAESSTTVFQLVQALRKYM